MKRVCRAAVQGAALLCILLGSLHALRAETPRSPDVTGQGIAARFGPLVARRLLASPQLSERLRGIERAALAGDDESLEWLLHALEPGGAWSKEPLLRLASLRALVRLSHRQGVQQLYVRSLSMEGAAGTLGALLRDTAAMGLASREERKGQDVLVAAVTHGGEVGRAAGQGLLAYPPRALVALLPAREGMTASLCAFLGQLGDARAIPALRAALVGGALREGVDDGGIDSFALRFEAARALATLGDREQLPVARGWMSSSSPEKRLAGAEILLESGASDGAQLLRPLFADERTRSAALELASRFPHAAEPHLLAEIFANQSLADRRKTVALLGELHASNELDQLHPRDSFDVTFALLHTYQGKWGSLSQASLPPSANTMRASESDPSPDTGRAGKSDPSPGTARARESDSVADARRLMMRGLVVQALVQDRSPSELPRELLRYLGAPDATDRAVGAWALVALGHASPDLFLSSDPVVVRGAARGLLRAEERLLQAGRARLAVERDPLTRYALSMALVLDPAHDGGMPLAALSSWANGPSPVAGQAAHALAVREFPATRALTDELLASPEPNVRSGTALGLAGSGESDAAARLAEAYRREPDPAVRRAIVCALGKREEPQRREPLLLAARLDPDPQVRRLASSALRPSSESVACDSVVLGRELAVLQVHPARSESSRGGPQATQTFISQGGLAATLTTSEGTVLPLVTDPDGVAVVFGLPKGRSSFRLASWAVEDNAPPP